MAKETTTNCFVINGYGEDFATGVCADGRQTVTGLLCPWLAAYFFSPDGILVGKEFRLWKVAAPRFEIEGPFKIYDERFQRALQEQFSRWRRSLGLKASAISIQEFWDPQYSVGVRMLPEEFADLESADSLGNEEEMRELRAVRDQWTKDGKFVWWWAKEYWMRPDGEVEST